MTADEVIPGQTYCATVDGCVTVVHVLEVMWWKAGLMRFARRGWTAIVADTGKQVLIRSVRAFRGKVRVGG